MRSVKLSILGSYWDSQIYSGELILFDWENTLHRIDWRAIIDELAQHHPEVQTALRVAFSDSDLFYNPKVRKILLDPAIKAPIQEQLRSLSALQLNPSTRNANLQRQKSPFDFLSADTEIYYGQIFACGDEGLFSASRAQPTSKYSRPTSVRCHDASIQQIKASDRHTAIAAAAGDDGLLEFPFRKDADGYLNHPRNLAKRACTACDWSFQSVMGWTTQSAFLASFREERDRKTNKILRAFDRIVDVDEIFGSKNSSIDSFTWGAREKIYRMTNQGIEVTNYVPPKSTKKNESTSNLNHKFHRANPGQNDRRVGGIPVATATASFGTVIEFDDHISVLRSDGEVEEFGGEAVHWRIFPRSDLYSNQLHILYEDHLLIVSFVHDYFVNQQEKIYGFSRASTMTEKPEQESATLW